jgi:hypothetical protein
MFVDLVLIPATTYVRMVSLPFPSVAVIAREIVHLNLASLDQLALYLPIMAVLLGIVAAYRSVTRVADRSLTSQQLWTLLQLTVFCLLFFFKGWVRASSIHMALSIIPSMVIMTVWQAELRSVTAQISFGVGIGCLLFISLPPMQITLVRSAENLVWALGGRDLSNGLFGRARSENGSCFPPTGLERIRCFVISPEQPPAIRYIQEHTTENEPIFVGLSRHDKIYMVNMLFYFVSERPSATKWTKFVPGVQTTIEVQSEIIRELRKSLPQYVVLSSKWDSHEEPNESADSSGVTILDQYIRSNYRPVASFGPLTILQYQAN